MKDAFGEMICHVSLKGERKKDGRAEKRQALTDDDSGRAPKSGGFDVYGYRHIQR
jgi:hypothetical protein